MFMTFYGTERGDHHAHEHAHESPMTMVAPLGVLALGAIFAGMLWYKPFFGDHDRMVSFFAMPHHVEAGAEHAAAADATDDHAAATEHSASETPAEGDHAATEAAAADDNAAMAGHAPEGAIYMSEASNKVLDDAHHAPKWVKASPFVVMLIGLFTAYVFYIRDPSIPGRLAEQQPILYRFLLNKWYFDEVYDAIFVNPARRLGAFLWKKGDGNVIDGTINGVAMGFIPTLTRIASRIQSGYIFTYAFAMVIGIALLLTWMTLSGGAH
jgi:NADH-quinone oxidoreductase subunit L